MTLASNVPSMVVGTCCYILSLVGALSSETSNQIVDYWIDYQCHVLDLMTLSFSLVLVAFRSIEEMFYASVENVDQKMGQRLRSTDYRSLVPIARPKSPVKSWLNQLFEMAQHSPLKIPHIQLAHQLEVTKLLRNYTFDVFVVSAIHFGSKLPYWGGFISPLMTFWFTCPVCGVVVASMGTVVSIPSLLPRFIIPCAPRRMFSMFKTPLAGAQYLPETRFVNILPLVMFLTTFRLLHFYLGIYFYRIPFSKVQVDQWIQSRSGVLIGYIVTVYIISSFLGPFGLVGIYAGIAGMGQLIANVTTTPPKAISLDSPPIIAHDDHNDQRSYSSSRLVDMQRLSQWIDGESLSLVSKQRYLRDIIEDFNRFID